MVRMAGGTSSQAYVVPASAIGGGALLAGADTLARTVRASIELPVGPFMVILGAPVFLRLLREAV
jgi:ABC-type Fe3+-siderophore transport system permease subunit